jgi:hypothetical protein
MEAITVATLIALVIKVVSVVKAIGKDTNLVLTQALTWVVGAVILSLAATADLTAGLTPIEGGPTLGELDMASIVLIGLAWASTASVVYDWKKARDNSDSAHEAPFTRL